MKSVTFMFLVFSMCACKRSAPEGTEPGDCNDEKDNDYDGRYDCDDDGCAMDTLCVNKAKAAEKAREAYEARTKATLAAKPKGAVERGPTFYVDKLMVQTNHNGSDINWKNAKSYCEKLNLLQHSDWRLPTREEVVKIIESGQLKGEPSYVMWTSTEKGKKRAVIVGMSGAVNDLAIQYDGECRARCVRGAITD